MFIEKVKKEELKKYFNKITQDFSISEFYSMTDEIYYLQLFTDNYSVKPEFVVTDFGVRGLNRYGRMNEKGFSEVIKEFMINKFGEEYKKAYNEDLNKDLNSEMIK